MFPSISVNSIILACSLKFQNMLTSFFEVHPPKTYSSNSTFPPNLGYCVLKEWIRISSIVHAKIDGNPVGGLRTL